MEEFVYPSLTPTSIDSLVWNENLYDQFMERLCSWEEQWDENKFQQTSQYIPNIHYLYKYRAFNSKHPEWTEELFLDKKMWSASLENLNDPLEAAFIFGSAVSDHVIADAVKMMMKSNWYGCICFSRDPVCVQMWAHYAENHSGYCVEYYRPSSFLLSAFCKPVMYRRTMPELKSTDLIDSLFWTKSEVWEYEAEWRLQYLRANAHTIPGLLKPHGVIFGLRTTESTKKFIRNCADDIRFGQIVPSQKPYQIRVQWE